MIRYRCPRCTLLTTAHERRVGQASVCKACLKPHQIPTDAALWLTETGEPLSPPASESEAAATSAPAAPEPVPSEVAPVHSEILSPEPISEEPALESATVLEHAPKLVPVVQAADARSEQTEPESEHKPERPTRVVRAAHDEPEPQPVPVATATPPPARKPHAPSVGRLVTVPHGNNDTPPPRSAEPVQLQTQADIAAALTTALTARMKPRAAPRRDLRPSTALWMLFTGLGVGFFLVSLFASPDNRWVTLALGVVQILLGYLWIVRLTHMRDPQRGLLCAVPFVTPYYLAQHKYARLRPLRFVLTGAALVALALAAPALAGLAGPLVQRTEPTPPPPDITTQPKLIQLRAYRDRGDYDGLVKALGVLTKTDAIRSADARDRAAIAAELESLCKHEDRVVRLEAMSAFVSWDLDPNAGHARRVCLDALRSQSEDERVRALVLLPRWKDAETARAAQSLIGRPSRQTNQAKKALEEIGGAPAEQAALVLLKRTDDLTVRLLAIDVLVTVGGPAAADELERFARTTDDYGARNSALRAVAALRARAAGQ